MALEDITEDILAFVKEALREDSFEVADITVAIQTCLNDLSNLDLLFETATPSVAADDVSIAYPVDYKPGSVISIVLINSSGVRQDPLEALSRGHNQYRELRDNDSATGEPGYFSEFDDKFWLWRPSNAAFATEIEYPRRHPQTPENILFGEDFRNVIYFGTTYFKALLRNKTSYIAAWGPKYFEEKEQRRLAAPEQPYITE